MSKLFRTAALAAAAAFAVAASAVPAANAGHEPEPWMPGGRSAAGYQACPLGHVPPVAFTDVAGNAHERQIRCLPWYGVANGVTATLYGPALPVRRDQFASLVARALTEARVVLPAGEGRFSDLDGNVHQDAVERLAAAGVVAGTGPGAFGPAGTVTRAQVAAFFARTYPLLTGEQQDEPEQNYFGDDNGHAHEDGINRAAEVGMVAGKVPPTPPQDQESSFIPGVYDPNAAVQRDQAASFLVRLLDFAVTAAKGSTDNPYTRGETIALKDGWDLTVTASDPDADLDIAVRDPDHRPPREGHRFALYRVRATRTGPGEALFDAGGRLVLDFGVDALPAGCGERPPPSALPAGPVPTGRTIEGTVCFEVPDGSLPPLVDARWGNPLEPHLIDGAAVLNPLAVYQPATGP